MKKNFKYALMGAIAFAGAVGFSACSSSDEIVDNPNYNPETNAVKTQFAISLGDNIVKTRMSSGNTQATGTKDEFRGIQNILLIPFKSGAATNANLNGKVIALTEAAYKDKLRTNEKNYLYNNVEVNTGTNYFAFYAVATPGSSTGAQVGRLTPNLPAENAASVSMSSYGFSLVPIMTSSEYSSAQTQANNVRDNLIAKLNQVLTTEGWKSSTNVALLQLYAQFKNIRVGSSEGVQKALQNLYTSANSITGDGVTVAAKIKDNILAELSSPKGDAVTVNQSEGTLTFGAGYNNYPRSIGLPNGSARLTFTDGGEGADTFGSADSEILWASNNTTAPGKFVYPADLRYFVQTDIKTATSEFLESNLDNPWATITGNAVYSGTAVSGTTRSIVLTKPIQYGVGRLETSIAAMSAEKYYDRDGNEVTIPSGGFTLTGIVIGGQKAVDWEFKPLTGTTEAPVEIYTIYDSDVSGVVAKETASAANHTLVLETEASQEVQIALQFTNNSNNAFKGKDGFIYPGQTFYLLGKLNPAGDNVTQPDGETINQVFLQDYVTKILLTIKPGSQPTTPGGVNDDGFGTAVSGLPDLTTSKMEFGLSVNLQWKPGLTFGLEI